MQATAVVRLLISLSLPSDRSTCHSIFSAIEIFSWQKKYDGSTTSNAGANSSYLSRQ
jgi:hypothetical protein